MAADLILFRIPGFALLDLLGVLTVLFILVGKRARGRSTVKPRPHGWPGFTLIELLTVVAIIGVLAAILIPGVAAAHGSAQRARSRLQFAAWTAAFEAFRQEYGRYPPLPDGTSAGMINAGASVEPAESHWFHDALAGRHRDGSALDESSPTNSRRLRFAGFGDEDFVTSRDVAEGKNRADELHFVRDAFGNTSIAVVVDRNLDGIINASDVAELPAVIARPRGTALRPAINLSGGGIRAGVIFYSARPGATSPEDLVTSWP